MRMVVNKHVCLRVKMKKKKNIFICPLFTSLNLKSRKGTYFSIISGARAPIYIHINICCIHAITAYAHVIVGTTVLLLNIDDDCFVIILVRVLVWCRDVYITVVRIEF